MKPAYDMDNLMSRIKNLQLFTIERELPEDFTFTGSIPYDMRISEGKMFVKVYAVDEQEAGQRVDEYLASNI